MKDCPTTEDCRHLYRNDNEDVFAELSQQGHVVATESKVEFFPENPIKTTDLPPPYRKIEYSLAGDHTLLVDYQGIGLLPFLKNLYRLLNILVPAHINNEKNFFPEKILQNMCISRVQDIICRNID